MDLFVRRAGCLVGTTRGALAALVRRKLRRAVSQSSRRSLFASRPCPFRSLGTLAASVWRRCQLARPPSLLAASMNKERLSPAGRNSPRPVLKRSASVGNEVMLPVDEEAEGSNHYDSTPPDRACRKKLSWSERRDIYHLPLVVNESDGRLSSHDAGRCLAVTWAFVSSGFLLIMLLMMMLSALGDAQ